MHFHSIHTEIAVVGESENTAKYAGIHVKKVIIRTMAITNPAIPQIATQYGLNENASDVILGIILFFLIGAEFFINYRVKRTKK